MSSINMTRTRVLLELWLLGKPKLYMNIFKPSKHVFRINGSCLTKFIGLLSKPKVNRLGDKLGSVYRRCTHVKELII